MTGCRYPRPCSCEFCMADIEQSDIRVSRIGRSVSPDGWDKECFECFAIGYHEDYCTKGE